MHQRKSQTQNYFFNSNKDVRDKKTGRSGVCPFELENVLNKSELLFYNTVNRLFVVVGYFKKINAATEL